MAHKFFHIIEATFILLFINIQPFFGVISAIAAATYYISMLKINVVDKKHQGSWCVFVKSVFKNN